MFVKNEIKDDIYEKFIKYAFLKCDAVMFVSKKIGFNKKQVKKLNETIMSIKKNFENSFLKSRNGCEWVSLKYGVGEENHKFSNMFEILFFETSKEIEDYLLSNKNLYSWFNPSFPEDIAFFKNGYCWASSVTHERECCINCENEKEYEYLKSIGIEFDEKKYLSTPKNKLYFENYMNL